MLNGLATGCCQLGDRCRSAVLLTANRGAVLKTHLFEKSFGERFFNYGNAPSNATLAASGFSLAGKLPILLLLTEDIPLIYEQIRNSISRFNLNVKILAGCDGLSVDDLSLLVLLPNMKIHCPKNRAELSGIVSGFAQEYGPAYVRFPCWDHNAVEDPLDFGNEVVILSAGHLTGVSREAVMILRQLGVKGKNIDIVTIKPLDRELVVQAAKNAKILVVVEESVAACGLSGLVARILCEDYPREMLRIGPEDFFLEAVDIQSLYAKIGLTGSKIAQRIYGWWRELGYH